ncbi:hypothetical protein MKEN_01280900 [Mycena kentingensis (nom. inval.)]|nr:hypothetical protein MKEN_01280900 [Mycena kentingensis (nom. inval.)]
MSWPTTNDDPATTLLRNKLAAKDTQLAAQDTELLRRAEQLDELKNTLNQTLHKLNQEVANGLNLESTLAKCRGDLSSEQLVSQNSQAAVLAMQEKLKEQDLEIRGLELNLESMSHNSNNSTTRTSKLEKEKSTLEARVRELEGNLRELSSPAPSTTATPSRSRAASRRRSSSVSDTRVAALEQDLRDTRASLAQKDAELQTASTKLSQTQTDLVRAENEKVATDKRQQAQIRELQSTLQEKEEDLELLRQQQPDGSREDELLKRIDEDEAKIAALQRLSAEAPKLKERVRQLEQQLLVESEHVMEMDRRNIELVREKEEALDEADDARAQVTQLTEAVKERDTHIAKQRQTQPNASEADVERLLVAIERIRGERDNLRRDVEFLQQESHFTEEALRSRIAALEQQTQSAQSPSLDQSVLEEKDQEIRRVGRVAMASAIVIEHLRSGMGVTAQQFLNASTSSEGAQGRLRVTDLQFSPHRRRNSDTSVFDLTVNDATQASAVQLETQIAELSQALDEVTAERDALNLQATNLTRDLEAAKRDINEGETRYTELQFHQLSSMTVNAATEALRQQLAEQESRVLRRTELVGILQHDNQQIVMNMKLQEERMMELTQELDMLTAQKEAMVEDCAEARHARDAALARVEEMDVEMERLGDAEEEICAMVGVVFGTVGHSRDALHQLREDAAANVLTLRSSWEAVKAELEQRQQALNAEVRQLKEQLELKDRMLADNDLEGEIARLRVVHVEEMGTLQHRLVELSSSLDEAQTRCIAAEANYQQAFSESTRSKEGMENAVADAEGLKLEMSALRDEHAEALQSLRDELAATKTETQKAQEALQEVEDLRRDLLNELQLLQNGSESRQRQLEDRVLELECLLEEQTARGDTLSEETDALRDQVQRETELRAEEKTQLEGAVENVQQAEVELAELRQELESVSQELARARLDADVGQEEKLALQEEITALKAQVQKVLSAQRVLESQVKDKEQLVATLNAEIESGKAQFSRVDKACKAAEMNLSLQTVQHRREVSELQRQVAALQAQPDLQAMVVELEERNAEMDELLKRKNLELEEYDDQAIEIKTASKKLAEKVESLTRKVKKLEAKLEAAKTAAASPPPAAAPVPIVQPQPRQRTNTFSSIASAAPSISSLPSVSSIASVPAVPPIPSYIPRSPSRNRVASGSALPRPKTPERKAIPTVFRSQTPERRAAVFMPPSPSAPVLGQKRRAPDDFENVHVPTQAFNADSMPDDGTPRMVRRPPGGGFTPTLEDLERENAQLRGEVDATSEKLKKMTDELQAPTEDDERRDQEEMQEVSEAVLGVAETAERDECDPDDENSDGDELESA